MSVILKVHYDFTKEADGSKHAHPRRFWRPGDVEGFREDPTDSLTAADFAVRTQELMLLLRFPGQGSDYSQLLEQELDGDRDDPVVRVIQRRTHYVDLNKVLSPAQLVVVGELKPRKVRLRRKMEEHGAKGNEVYAARKRAGQAISDRKARALEYMAIVDELDTLDDELRSRRLGIIDVPDPVGDRVIINRGLVRAVAP